MYEQQIESKSFRGMSIVFKACFVPDEVYNERYKKYFKTHYKGKPTKRYLKLEQRINKADSYPSNTLERLMINNSIK